MRTIYNYFILIFASLNFFAPAVTFANEPSDSLHPPSVTFPTQEKPGSEEFSKSLDHNPFFQPYANALDKLQL
jgi:hypothetical protein